MTMKLETEQRSADTLNVKVPDELREKFETAIQDHLTRSMRLRDGITIAADPFITDVEFEDPELREFHIAVIDVANGIAVSPESYLFY